MTGFINYGAHEQIKQALEGSGVKPGAVQDFIEDFEAHRFKIEDVTTHIEKMKVEKDHRFFPTGGSQEGLARDAWLHGNVTKAGQFVRQYGEEAAAAAAARYGNTMIPFRRGTEPEAERVAREGNKPSGKNPWSATPENLDANGRYNAAAFKRQAELVRLNQQAAVGIAKAAGAKIGDVRPPRNSRVA